MLVADLTKGEKLTILRRRARRRPHEMAADLGISMALYRAWERDEEDPPDLPLDEVRVNEYYMIRRLRAGITISEMADYIGDMRQNVCGMEAGRISVKKLRMYWGDL